MPHEADACLGDKSCGIADFVFAPEASLDPCGSWREAQVQMFVVVASSAQEDVDHACWQHLKRFEREPNCLRVLLYSTSTIQLSHRRRVQRKVSMAVRSQGLQTASPRLPFQHGWPGLAHSSA